ncbi:zinc knuckle CX2CX4HX4C containing protein [Tanacetum coccineum]
MSSVLEVKARFENTLYKYFIGKKVAFLVFEMYILNAWEKYGVKRVTEDKNGFFFIQFTRATSLERVLEHGLWLICNAPFILRKWSPSYVLSKEELTFVLVWIKFHGIHISVFTVDGLSAIATLLGTLIMVDQALMETMMISIPNPASNGVSMHTIKVEYEWKPPRCETCLVFGHDDAHCPKRVIADLKNLSKHGGTSNDGFQTGQRKCIRDPLISKHGTRGNHSLLEQQVPNSVFQKKTSILMSNAFYALEDDNGKPMKSILRNPWESDDADVENGYDETATFVASTSLVTTMPTYEVPSPKSFVGLVIVAFTANGLSPMATKLGNPIFLDSYTSFMCLQSWGHMDYACALIDIRVGRELKDEMVIAIPNMEDDGDVLHSRVVEKSVNDGSRMDKGGNNGGIKNFIVSVKPKTQYCPKAKQPFEGMSNSLKKTPFVLGTGIKLRHMKLNACLVWLQLRGKLVLVDDDGNPFEKVDYPDDLGNDCEVEPVDTEMETFLASNSIVYVVVSVCDDCDVFNKIRELHVYVWKHGILAEASWVCMGRGSDECDFGQTFVGSKGNITEESVNQTVMACEWPNLVKVLRVDYRKDIKHLDNNKNPPGTSEGCGDPLEFDMKRSQNMLSDIDEDYERNDDEPSETIRRRSLPQMIPRYLGEIMEGRHSSPQQSPRARPQRQSI